MKKTKFNFLISFFWVFIISSLSCKKSELTTGDNNLINQDKIITANFYGRVVNEYNEPINGVLIEIGNKQTTTNNDGIYSLINVLVIENLTYIKASKKGYFQSGKTIKSKEKIINNINLILVEKKLKGIINSNEDNTVNIGGGSNIQFTANSFLINSTSEPYVGKVKVFAYNLNPTIKNEFESMPGALLGLNENNNLQSLLSFGMVAVELEDENGKELNINPNKPSTIFFNIDPSILSSAPNEISLWYFNEKKGLWIEEGKAQKQNGKYIANVKHFTWWNCDYGGGPIEISLRLIDKNGTPLPNTYVQISSANSFGVGGGNGYTSSDGNITSRIPQNTIMRIKVFSQYRNNACSNMIILDSTLQTYSSSTNIGDIVINNNNSLKHINFEGNYKDCNNNFLNNEFADVYLDNQHFALFPIVDGNLLGCVPYCSNNTPNKIFAVLHNSKNYSIDTFFYSNKIDTGNIKSQKQICLKTVTKFNYIFQLKDIQGNNLAQNTNVTFYFNNDSIKVNNANVSKNIYLPINTKILRVINAISQCGNSTIIKDSIGSFNQDFNAGNIIVNLNDDIEVEGLAFDCNNNLISIGTAYLYGSNGNVLYNKITNGYFKIKIPLCSRSNTINFNLKVLDSSTNKENDTTYSFSIASNFFGKIALGSFKACGQSSIEFLNYSYYGNQFSVDPIKLWQNGTNTTYFSGSSSQQNNAGFVNANFDGITIGTYRLNARIQSGNYVFKTSNSNLPVIYVTKYGTLYNFVEASFSGYFFDSVTNLNVPVTGNLRMRRTF